MTQRTTTHITLIAAVALSALGAIESSASAQLTAEVPGYRITEVASGSPLGWISGIAVHSSGHVFIADIVAAGTPGQLRRMAPDGTITTLNVGVPLRSPGRMAFVDDDTLILAEWNANGTSPCCSGSVLEIELDASLNVVSTTVRSDGTSGVTTYDPKSVALGKLPGWPSEIYVMDFVGGSVSNGPPFLFQIDGTSVSTVLQSSEWDSRDHVGDIEFGRGGAFFGHDLYVLETSNVPRVWRVTSSLSVQPFVGYGSPNFAAQHPLGTPLSLRFGRGVDFPSDLYVLDNSTKQIIVVDGFGDTSVFMSGVVSRPFADMAFHPDGSALYLGLTDRVVRVDRPVCP